MVNILGWEIKRQKEEPVSFAPPVTDDGAVVVAAGGSYGTYVDLEGSVKTEAELVTRYRDMSLHPEVDSGIEEIVNETIVTEEGEKTVEVVLDDLPGLPAAVKNAIQAEFDNVLRLLEFNTKSYDVFRRWYIDGRLYYHVIIDEKAPIAGIQELRYLDPRKVRKIREVSKKRDKNNPLVTLQKTTAEYYMYSDKGLADGNKSIITQSSTTGIKIANDAVLHCTSGITDPNGKMVLSHLHKAIKPLNQLRALEDATVIYRLSRAPERRVFYLDVGNLPKPKAEQYVRDMMVLHKNKLVYDATTGEVRDDRKFMTMLEDYWLPRRGDRSTQIETLSGGANLGEMTDVEYFQDKLYKSLNVPTGRLKAETVFMSGRSMEITREEVKFAKFIDRLRTRFNSLFLKALEKQLILKMVLTPEDWEAIEPDIRFRYLQDNYFEEMKEQEIILQRLNILNQASLFAGKYFSHDWLRRHILKQNDEEIEEIDSQIMEEMNNPQFYPPIDSLAEMEPGVPPPPGPQGNK